MPTKPIFTLAIDDVEHWNFLLSGDSGVGKSVFAGSDLKVLFIAPEDDGLMSSARINKQANPSKIKVRQWEDMKNAYEWFEENPDELKKFNVISIDSLPEMQYLAKDYVLRITRAEKLRKNQDPDKMQLQDYGIMHDIMENMVRGFNDLPVNVLWTSTAKKVTDADDNPFIVPDLMGKGDYGIAMKMVALMTSYGYMRTELHTVAAPTDENPEAVKEVKRRVIYWEDTGTIRAKDRTIALAPYTINMTLQQMRNAIAGKMIRNADGFIVKKGQENNTAKAETKTAKSPVVQASPKTADVAESSEEDRKQLEADVVAVAVQKDKEETETLETVEA